MPYPVSPPPLPAMIDVVPGEFSDTAITALTSESSSPESAPNSAAPLPVASTASSATPSLSIDLQILDPQFLEGYPTNYISQNQAESLGSFLEVGLPAPVPAASPIASDTAEPGFPDLLAPQVDPEIAQEETVQEETYSSTLPASRLPELAYYPNLSQARLTQDWLAQNNTQPLNDSLEDSVPDALEASPEVVPESVPEDATEVAPEVIPSEELAPQESVPEENILENPGSIDPPAQDQPQDNPAEPSVLPPGSGSTDREPLPVDPAATADVLELNADRQEYDERNRVFQAEGNVELLFRGARLTSTRLLVNIPNRIAVAEGDAVLTRGSQILQGDRIEYNLVQNQGTILGARGQLLLPAISDDTAATPPITTESGQPPLDQPLQVLGSPGGLTFGVTTPGQSTDIGGAGGEGVGRLRYEADQIEFSGAVWEATNVRITNDPFSPPELELRSSRVTVTPLGPGRTEIRARNPRLVFDQGFSLPLLQNRFIIDNRERNPGLLSFGFDERDRGGFFVERGFDFSLARGLALLSLTPQVLVQRAIDEGFGASSFGLIARLDVNPSPTTSIEGNATFTTFDFDDFEDTFRGSFRAQQIVFRHTAALEYSYRDRLYNGSLGFQDVQSSLGLVVTSPTYRLGNTGINLVYQAGAQYINSDANSRRLDESEIRDLLDFNEDGTRDNNRIDLTRYQAAVSLNRVFLLWAGRPLPPTPDQGLRYTPNPIVPYVGLYTALRGVFSAYSNGDTQSVLSPTVGLSGQFGNFSRPFLDYTGFGISYSYNAVGGETPFNFDRVNDIQTLTLSLNQQIYGPFRFGVRSTFYLESRNDRENDADTTFTLEYSRRTYSITLSYSPQRESGAVGLRISDFNWVGDPGPFTGLGADDVSGGVRIPGE